MNIVICFYFICFVQGAFITIAAEGDYEPQRLVERHLKDLGFPSSFVWCWRLAAFCFFFLLFVSVDKCQPQSTHPTQAPFVRHSFSSPQGGYIYYIYAYICIYII